jgi:hypothetical protein
MKFLEMELEFKICTKCQTQNYYNGSAMCKGQNIEYQEGHSNKLKERKDGGKKKRTKTFHPMIHTKLQCFEEEEHR